MLAWRRTLRRKHINVADDGDYAGRHRVHLKLQGTVPVVGRSDRQSQFELVRSVAERLTTAVQRQLAVSSIERETDKFDGERSLGGVYQFQT